MMERLSELILDTACFCFMPLVCSYYAISASIFINTSAKDAEGLEWIGNTLLAPTQYLLAGKEAIQDLDGNWQFKQRFDYNNAFWVKTASSIFALPPSIFLGTAVKGMSLLSSKTRERHHSILTFKGSTHVQSNVDLYQEIGINTEIAPEPFLSQGFLRGTEKECVLKLELDALKEIAKCLNQANILWWVDCGTCLGAYRYGGVIPWDWDIDVAVLLPDFENVCRALNRLDKNQYVVQDWSSRDFPDSYLKVYIRKTGTMIDIYHFAIDQAKKEIQYVLSLENNIFFPSWWKVRESVFKTPATFEMVFPLKKAVLDGIEVFVPNQTKSYLQRCYGENLEPAKIYNPITGNYEKDLSHPYWERSFAH